MQTMKLVRRTRTAVPAKSAVRTIVRRSVVAKASAKAPPDNRDIVEDLRAIVDIDNEVAALQQQIASLNTQREQSVAEIAKKFHDRDIATDVVGHGLRAGIEETKSRATTTIDPVELYNHLRKEKRTDDFWECVTVGVTQARAVLSAREIEAIADVEEAKKTGEKFTVTPLKKSKSK